MAVWQWQQWQQPPSGYAHAFNGSVAMAAMAAATFRSRSRIQWQCGNGSNGSLAIAAMTAATSESYSCTQWQPLLCLGSNGSSHLRVTSMHPMCKLRIQASAEVGSYPVSISLSEHLRL
eukprot:1161619-Pelagomonas_calceolata.AAC.9